MADSDLLIGRDLHKPSTCEKCGDSMKYKGIGEYVCEGCGHVMYDDYGKVRSYLESHRGATQGETAQATGVAPNVIRQFLRDDKIEIAPNSAVFIFCESCGTPIRSGRLCSACERAGSVKGFGKATGGSSGARRFSR